MPKIKLRLTSKGWYRFWAVWKTGYKDVRTGATIPDAYGCTEQHMWVGPFATAPEAFEFSF